MTSSAIVGAILVLLAIVYQIYVSRRVVNAPDYTDQQRRLQLIMIWCLPIIGSAVCHLMLGESTEAAAGENVDSSDHDGYDGGHGGGDGDGGTGD